MSVDVRAVDPRDAARFRAALTRGGPRPGRLERVLRSVIHGGCRLVAWHISVDGVAALPAITAGLPGSGCVVACAPHRTWLEPFLLLQAWPVNGARLVWLADGHTVTRSAWRRRLLPAVGIIPIEGRFGGPADYVELAMGALAAGRALVVFPERGAPSPPQRTRRLSAGFAYLARAAGAPVVPVVVAGTHDIRRGSHFRVTYVQPMMTGAPDPEPMSSASRAAAHALASRTAEAINAALPGLNALTDARLPARARWTWLGRLFH